VKSGILTLDPTLQRASRLARRTSRQSVNVAELLALVSCGVMSTCLTTYVKLNLQIPGHHIMFAVFPMALGFALVPRRFAGTTMGGAALGATFAFWGAGIHVGGVGALTSLWLAGPMLDLALRWGKAGWRVYGALVLAGAATNAASFLVRGTFKYFGLGGAGGSRTFTDWLPNAVQTYVLAGILAGLVSAAAWFHVRARDDTPA
jgi:hypothetical protein